MFEFLSNFIENLWTFLTTAWDFIINFFKEIVYVIQLLANVLLNAPSYFVWLPSVVTTLIITGLTIIVVYKVIGRS